MRRAERLVERPWRLVLLVLLIVLPLLVLGELAAADAGRRARQNQEDALMSIAQRSSEVLVSRTTLLIDQLSGAASATGVRTALGWTVALDANRHLTLEEPDVRELAFQLVAFHATMRSDVQYLLAVDGVGTVLVADPPERTAGSNNAGAPQFVGSNRSNTEAAQALALHEDRYIGADPNEQLVMLAVPVLEASGRGTRTKGSLVALLRADAVESWLKPLGDSVAELYVVDRQGRLLARVNSGTRPFLQELGGEPTVAAAISGRQVLNDARDPLSGTPALLATATANDVGWTVVAVAKESALQAEVDTALAQQRALRLGLGGVLLLGAALVGVASSTAIRRRRESVEALEQQTATAEVLKTINRSAFDLQSVFDVVVQNALLLCRGDFSYLFRRDGDVFRIVSSYGGTPELLEYERAHPTPISRTTLIGRLVLDRTTVHIPDLFEDPTYDWPSNRAAGVHTVLGVPIFRDDVVVGAIGVARNEKRPFSESEIRLVTTFADQAAIAMENVRLFNETQEALGQQTALSDVLRTISRSAFDLDAVLQTIVERAAGLVGAESSRISRRDGDDAVVLAGFGPRIANHGGPGTRIPVSEATLVGRALLTGRRQYTVDATLNPDLPQDGPRTRLVIPFMRDGKAVGTLGVSHELPRPFSDRELQMLDTFADQAAIAIENVRLFNETKEALEQQTALSEILRVIASSPASEQPVLQAIAENAARFCRAADAVVVLTHQNELSVAAHHGPIPSLGQPLALERSAVAGRAVLDGRTVHVADILGPEGDEFPQARARADATGQRAMLAAPLLRDGVATGAIILRKQEPVPFTPTQIQLVEAFAHQAVIAIENVRLFNETKEALKQRTATSEILRVISETLGDPQPVMQAIVDTVLAVCSADSAGFFRRSGDDLILRAVSGTWRGPRPSDVGPQLPFHGDSIVVSALEEGRYQHVADTSADPRYDAAAQWSRTRLAVPVLRGSEALGVIRVGRTAAGGFSEREIHLVQGFAEQAAIAFENARLFNETKESLERQTSISDVLQTIGRSAFDLQPVLDTVVERAVKLCDAREGSISTLEDGVYRTRAYRSASSLPPAYIDFMRQEVRTPGRGSLTGRTALEGHVVHIADVLEDPEYTATDMQKAAGYRTLLGVPLLRDGKVIGVFALTRSEVRPFSDRQIELVRTFADQAAIAIENTRLFVATKEALERQSAVAQVLGEISQSGFQLQPVLESVIEAATKLCAAQQGFIYRREGDVFRLVVAHGITPEFKAFTEANPINPMGRGTVTGRVAEDRKTVHIPDVLSDREYTYWEAQRLGNFRAILGVPMMRDDEVIGVMLLWRTEPRPFADDQIALVTTFANQASIAIENVRLFDETKEALERQSAVSEVLKTISGTVFDLDPTLQTVVENAAKLADADVAWMMHSIDSKSYTWGPRYGRTPQIEALFGERPPLFAREFEIDRARGSIVGRVYSEARTIEVSDAADDAELLRRSATVRATKSRSLVGVPVLSEGAVTGAIILGRKAVRPFSEREVQLVETFANQAAIAIRNVRLFNEIQDKSRQLEVASRHKSEFLANMSHELRTPLNAIIGFSEVLVQGLFGDVNEKQREYLQDVIGSGQHLLSLINDILDLSKIEAGRMELELSTFNFRDALQSGMTIVRERASRHNITLSVVVADDVGPVEADERKVKQIFFNLLSNAVKFTPDGGQVDVTVRRDNGDVHVEVRDNGIGIADTDQARIFEEFQQVGRERSREGTGLGLTLTKRFVELHGGRIWLESAPGQGSTFTFTLPLRRAAPVRA